MEARPLRFAIGRLLASAELGRRRYNPSAFMEPPRNIEGTGAPVVLTHHRRSSVLQASPGRHQRCELV